MRTDGDVKHTVRRTERKSIIRRWHHATGICLLIVGCCLPLHSANASPNPDNLTADVIVEKLQAADLRRAKALRSYTGKRAYKLDYRGFPGGRHAEMIVEVTYILTSPRTERISGSYRRAGPSSCYSVCCFVFWTLKRRLCSLQIGNKPRCLRRIIRLRFSPSTRQQKGRFTSCG